SSVRARASGSCGRVANVSTVVYVASVSDVRRLCCNHATVACTWPMLDEDMSGATRSEPLIDGGQRHGDSNVNSASAQVSEALCDDIRIRETRLRARMQECENCCGESCAQRPRFGRADVRIREERERLSGEVVVAARLRSGQPFAQAGQ